MAQVTGWTAAEIDEEMDALLISGVINQTSGHLLLNTRGGAVIDAGAVQASGVVDWIDVQNKPTAFTPTTYTHTQDLPAETWTINHNLGRYPQVTIVDSSGSVVFGDVSHTDNNTAVATFGGAFGGKAYLT